MVSSTSTFFTFAVLSFTSFYTILSPADLFHFVHSVAAAICWKDKKRLDSWKNCSIFLGMNKEIIDVELWAIATGLDIAGKMTLKCPKTVVTIFSDSREVLNTLGQLSVHTGTPYLRKLICQKLSNLERKGKSVTLR